MTSLKKPVPSVLIFQTPWHGFLKNLCQTCANPWHGFLASFLITCAKVVPNQLTKNNQPVPSAKPYIRLAHGMGFVENFYE